MAETEQDPNPTPTREVPIDWESASLSPSRTNAPEVHNVMPHPNDSGSAALVDGVADTAMHVRIAAAKRQLPAHRSRELSRAVPLHGTLHSKNWWRTSNSRDKLTQAIGGKGAFRRFKDVPTSYGAERERWFTFRSERLRTSHGRVGSVRTPSIRCLVPMAGRDGFARARGSPPRQGDFLSSMDPEGPKSSTSGRRTRNAEATREHLRELVRGAGPRATWTRWSLSPRFHEGAPRRAAALCASPRAPAPREREQSVLHAEEAKLAQGAVGKEGGDA